MRNDSTTVQDIVERLVLLSETQGLIEQAKGGYADWYTNESSQMPYKTEEVHMEFWRQTLYFQPGIGIRGQIYPYIVTAFKMIVQNWEFGDYDLITDLDGTVNDDSISWGEPLFYQLLDEDEYTGQIGPIDTSIGVPENLRDIFPRLSHFATQQELLPRVEQRCRAWFQEHPLWFQQYPRCFVEEPNPNSRWFHDHPTWSQGYPAVPFSNGHEVRTSFDRQLLCFNHVEFRLPHILTKLNVFAGEYHIGEYCLATDLHGTVIEGLSGIFPFPFYR